MPAIARVSRLSPEWARLQRQQSRALLDAEANALDGMTDDVDETVDETIQSLRKHADRRSEHGRAGLLALLLFGGQRLTARLRRRIQRSRSAARVAAIGRLRAELALASTPLAIMARAPATDMVHAAAAADSAKTSPAGRSRASCTWAAGARAHS